MFTAGLHPPRSRASAAPAGRRYEGPRLPRHPTLCARERFVPIQQQFSGAIARHRRLESSIDLPIRDDFVIALPVTYRATREISRAKRGGFDDLRAYDRHTEQVGLKLHQ